MNLEEKELHFGEREIPPELANWREVVDYLDNDGLALRWVAAAVEIRAVMGIPPEERKKVQDHWNYEIRRQLAEFPIFDVSGY